MKTISRSALVNYSIEQMYDLVNDIEAYPTFMEGCINAKVINSGDDFIEARLVLSQLGIQQSFVTRNELHPPRLMIMHLLEGPFKHFEGCWQFEPRGESGCEVSFYLRFMFANSLLTSTASKWLEKIVGQQVDALCQRADTLFGS